MTHANGSGTDPEAEKGSPSKELVKASKATNEVLSDPESQGKIKDGLVQLSLFLRRRAQAPDSRQERAVTLLDSLTPEAQKAFLEDRKGWIHAAKEGTLNAMIPGRSIYKLGKPSLAPRDWVSLSDYSEELEVYISLGVTNVDEDVAQSVDGMLKDKVHMLKWASVIVAFIPEAGLAIAELLSGIAHLTEAPAAFLQEALPEVRAAVRNGSDVLNQEAATRADVKKVYNS